MSKEKQYRLVPRLRFPVFKDTAGWEEGTLGAVASFLNGKAYKQEELLELGKYRVLRVGNFFTNNEWYYSDLELDADKYCEKGDLLYAWSASFGPRIWQGEKTIYHYHIWKVIENERVDKKFLFILLDYETEKIKAKQANGLGLLHITKGAIEGWECLIPPNRSEQQKIADCILSLDELLAAEIEKMRCLKAHKSGLLQSLFPRDGAMIPLIRFPEFTDTEEWQEKSLYQVADYENGKAHEQDISDTGKYVVINSKFISSEGEVRKFTNVPCCLAKKNNIVMVLSDLPNGKAIAKCFFIDRDDYYTINQRICKLTTFNGDSVMLFYILNRNQYFLAFDDGVKQTNLRKEDVLNCLMLLPESLAEQQKIAACLSTLDERIASQGDRINALKMHKKGLMQQLFPSSNDIE